MIRKLQKEDIEKCVEKCVEICQENFKLEGYSYDTIFYVGVDVYNKYKVGNTFCIR